VPGYLKLQLAKQHMMVRVIGLKEVNSKSYLLVSINDNVHPLAKIEQR
jgi:hypothetical protein